MLQISSLLLFYFLQSLCLLPGSGLAEPIGREQTKSEAVHKNWDTLLKKYVDDKGNVDYLGFKAESETLDQYLEQLGSYEVNETWSKEKKLAYYINLYNAATVKLILDNYPIASIMDINKPWGKSWIKQVRQLISLGHIEHNILRKMNEPRIHFAINCASISCPRLLNEAYTEDRMEQQLATVTKEFINDPDRNIISEDKIELSRIFKWYKKDFENKVTLLDYLNQFVESPIDPGTKIDFLKYNWSLNESR
jgi:hypothetical protein